MLFFISITWSFYISRIQWGSLFLLISIIFCFNFLFIICKVFIIYSCIVWLSLALNIISLASEIFFIIFRWLFFRYYWSLTSCNMNQKLLIHYWLVTFFTYFCSWFALLKMFTELCWRHILFTIFTKLWFMMAIFRVAVKLGWWKLSFTKLTLNFFMKFFEICTYDFTNPWPIILVSTWTFLKINLVRNEKSD